MKALVIGGSGLFGRKTIAYLLREPGISSVTSLDWFPPHDWFLKSIQGDSSRFHFIRGDVSRLEDILNALALYPCDVLINWAFVMGDEVNSNPRLATRVNALGMCNAFEAARLASIKRVIFASSETVYGPQEMYGDREVSEEDQTHPTHSYSVCKLFAEIIAAQYAQRYGINFTGIRAAMICGHGAQARLSRMFSDIISLPTAGQPVRFEVDGKALFSLAWTDDLAELTRRLVLAPSSPHLIYNLGGRPCNMLGVASIVKRLLPGAEITFGKQPMLGPGQQGMPWKISMNRAQCDFGFSCLTPDEAIVRHIEDARLEAETITKHQETITKQTPKDLSSKPGS